MAVQYYNGQLYDVLPQRQGMAAALPMFNIPKGYSKIPTLGYAMPIGMNLNNNSNNSFNVSGMYKDPFGTASSGGQSGTLQPYVNRMTQNASNALYGGLLGYSPQSMVAGDAGGTPQNSTVPQFNIPSALSKFGNGLNFTGFGNRSWMGGGNGN